MNAKKRRREMSRIGSPPCCAARTLTIATWAGIAGLFLGSAGCDAFNDPFAGARLDGNYAVDAGATYHAYKDGVWVSPSRATGSPDEVYAFISPGGRLLLTYRDPISGDVLFRLRGTGGPTEVEVYATGATQVSDYFEYYSEKAATLNVSQRASNCLVDVQSAVDTLGGGIQLVEIVNSGKCGLEIDAVQD